MKQHETNLRLYLLLKFKIYIKIEIGVDLWNSSSWFGDSKSEMATFDDRVEHTPYIYSTVCCQRIPSQRIYSFPLTTTRLYKNNAIIRRQTDRQEWSLFGADFQVDPFYQPRVRNNKYINTERIYILQKKIYRVQQRTCFFWMWVNRPFPWRPSTLGFVYSFILEKNQRISQSF